MRDKIVGDCTHALLGVLILLMGLAWAQVSEASEVFWVNSAGVLTNLANSCPPQPKPLPVLFIHGHGASLFGFTATDDHYKENWHDDGGVPSVRGAVELQENQGLGIEAYYIKFLDQGRSIVQDAKQIGEAIERIQNCHDSNFDPSVAGSTTDVKVAVIAFSKGTISTRLYLKSLQTDVSDLDPNGVLDPPNSGYYPVSEFIAISPPNHATSLPALNRAVRQLNNGYRVSFLCGTSYDDDEAINFITKLNTPDEAPGSRAPDGPVSAGTLYVALYADNNRDTLVGGDTNTLPDCMTPPRRHARNLSPNAVNREVEVLPGETDAKRIHQETVHDTEVICRALYTVFHHRFPPDSLDPVCENPAGVPIIPLGTAVVLALDHSGSMGDPACPGCSSKQQVLAEAVQIFLDLWSVFGSPQDRVGTTYFRTTISKFAHPASGGHLIPLLPDIVPLVDDLLMESANPGGATAMGGALQSAIQDLQAVGGNFPGVGGNRHVILFTDGMQNVNPMIRLNQNGTLVIDNEAGRLSSGILPTTPNPMELSMGLGIKVDVIVTDVSPQGQTLLDDIALNTGGAAKFHTDPNVLRQFFCMQLIDTLRGSSPQLIDYRYGTLQNNEAAEAFPVNAGAEKVVLKLSWQQGDEMDFRVEKDGLDVTSYGRHKGGGFYRIFAIDLPAQVDGGTVRSGGEWRMRIQGQPGASYEVAALVDEPLFIYTVSLGGRDYRVGDALDLEMSFLAGDDPILQAPKVTATVLRPTQSAGNLLASHPARAEPPRLKVEPLASPGQRALARLLEDEKVWQSLQLVADTVTLTGEGKGTYRASFPSTTMPGIYTAVFRFEIEDPKFGTIRRIEAVSTLVRFGKAELEESDVRLTLLARTDRGREMELHLSPRDRYGNYLGPDFGRDIRVDVSEGIAAGEARDLGNGTYVVPLIVPEGADPKLTLTVAGEEVFGGALSDLGAPADWQGLTLVRLLILGGLGALLIISIRLLIRRSS